MAQVENKIPIDVEEYVQKLKPQLMDVVLHWLEGKRFHEIMMLGTVRKKGILCFHFHRFSMDGIYIPTFGDLW